MAPAARSPVTLAAVLLLLVAPSLAGCGTTTYRALNPPNPREAIVCIIRQRAEPTGWTLDVLVDGERAAVLADNASVTFSVPAGLRTLRFEWPKLATKVGLAEVVDLRGGQTRYLLLAGTIQGPPEQYQGMNPRLVQTMQLVELTAERGEQLLRDLAAGK